MAYTNSIPLPTDYPSNSQPQIKANFESIYTAHGINHVQFDDPSGNQGKHKYISFPEQSAAPAVAANEIALYSQTSQYSSGSTTAEIFVKDEDGNVVEFTSALKGDTGWTILPSGILMKWYKITPSGTGSRYYDITWTVGATHPQFSATPYSAQVTPYYASTSDVDVYARVSNLATTGLQVVIHAPTGISAGAYVLVLGTI